MIILILDNIKLYFRFYPHFNNLLEEDNFRQISKDRNNVNKWTFYVYNQPCVL